MAGGLQIKIWAGITALLVFIALLRAASYHPQRVILRQYEQWSGLLKERQENSTWYQRTEARLKKNGAAFHFGSWINPLRYLLLRLVLASLGIVVMGKLSVGYGALSAICMFGLPEWLMGHLNQRDNQRMLPEIKLVYHALEIQIKAGVYVTDALSECYGSVRERRLQQALLDLAGSIVMKADIYDALDAFEQKFDNRYIDSLCITILQACESGQAVEALSDIGEQLKDMETVLLQNKKNSIDRSITFYQLGFLMAVLGVVVYACVSYLFSAAVQL